MPDDFVVARNPEPDSSLPYLLRLPLGDRVVLKARETWPRTAKVYCRRAPGWPAEVEVVERVAVRTCVRRGPAVDLVLDRGRESRSQFVFTRIRGGREAIFWQSARTAKQARPGVRLPTARPPWLPSWSSSWTSESGTPGCVNSTWPRGDGADSSAGSAVCWPATARKGRLRSGRGLDARSGHRGQHRRRPSSWSCGCARS